jgi:hypothetical protein
MSKSKKTNTTKNGKTTRKPASTGDRLRKEALAVTQANIERIEAKERGENKNAAGKIKAPKAAKPQKEKKASGLDLAAKVLAASKEPLAAKAITEATIAAGWKTNGKTPHATLYAAIIREISVKGKDARFKKTDRGLFTANAGAK